MRTLTFLLLLVIPACAQDTAPPRGLVDVGGHRLYAEVTGAGPYTVVIDGGLGSQLEEWYPFRDRLAGRARVVLYDRAGYGRSEAGPLPRHSRRAAEELKALLDGLSVSGPVILVGHSLGALNVQVFADMYGQRVAGMVLLDPPPLGWLLGEGYPALRALAHQMTANWKAEAQPGLASEDAQARGQAEFLSMVASEHESMFGESASQAAAIQTFGDLPLTVVASGEPNPAFGEVAEEYQLYWAGESRSISSKSSQGEFLVALNSGHMLHVDAVDLVYDTVLKVLAAIEKQRNDS